MPGMIVAVVIAARTGIRLAEIGFLFIMAAGIWLIVAEISGVKLSRASVIIAGIALVAASVLLIIATHWGHFA